MKLKLEGCAFKPPAAVSRQNRPKITDDYMRIHPSVEEQLQSSSLRLLRRRPLSAFTATPQHLNLIGGKSCFHTNCLQTVPFRHLSQEI